MASRSINRVELLGHLGGDADVKFTPSGKQVAQLSVATSHRWKPQGSDEWKEEPEWHRVVLWNSENVVKFLTKGKQVHVTGRLRTRNYLDSEGVKHFVTEIIAEDVILLGGGAREGGE